MAIASRVMEDPNGRRDLSRNVLGGKSKRKRSKGNQEKESKVCQHDKTIIKKKLDGRAVNTTEIGNDKVD